MVVSKQENKNEGGFVEVKTNEVFTFKSVGDQITGALLGKSPGAYDNFVYDIEVSPGEAKTVFGITVLDQKLKKVEVGCVVRITYLGEKISNESKRKYKDFKVEVKK